MNQIWQFWRGGASEALVNNIIEVGNQYPVQPTGMGFDGAEQNTDQRSSELRWIDPNHHVASNIVAALWYYGREANRNAFGFDIDYMPEIQYTTYYSEAQGKYDWHCDTFWANPSSYDRKISIIIQLSDSSDYEGGDFEIDPRYPPLPKDAIRDKGTVIVIPSFVNHRVTPVTSGIRKSLVTWIQGPKFR